MHQNYKSRLYEAFEKTGLKDNSNYRIDDTVKLHMTLMNIRYQQKDSKARNFDCFLDIEDIW